jgi:hypothetical protein
MGQNAKTRIEHMLSGLPPIGTRRDGGDDVNAHGGSRTPIERQIIMSLIDVGQ